MKPTPKEKQIRNQTRQQFLLTFFNEDKYTEKEINNFVLVKQYNGEKNCWQVAIYTLKAFRKYKNFNERQYETKVL